MHTFDRDFWKDFKAVAWAELPSVFQHDVPEWENGLLLVGDNYIVLLCQGYESEPSCDLEAYIFHREKMKAITLEDFERCGEEDAKFAYQALQRILEGDKGEYESFAHILFRFFDAFRQALLKHTRYREIEES